MTTTVLNNVCWGYEKGGTHRKVLDHINLSIQQGEVIAILGQSGSGKSSLLNVISGIERVDQGQVSINNIPVSELSEQERTLFRRQHIGFIYQFFNLIPTLTVFENIALVAELNHQPRSQIINSVSELLRQLDLDEKHDEFPDVLSGGEQQRVAIARALIHQPALILADEPTGNLDTHTGQQVLTLFIKQAKVFNSSLLIVTHSKVAADQADRVLTLVDGQLIENRDEPAW